MSRFSLYTYIIQWIFYANHTWRTHQSGTQVGQYWLGHNKAESPGGFTKQNCFQILDTLRTTCITLIVSYSLYFSLLLMMHQQCELYGVFENTGYITLWICQAITYIVRTILPNRIVKKSCKLLLVLIFVESYLMSFS